MKRHSGLYKLGEECSELSASILKYCGKMEEQDADPRELDNLLTSLLKEIGDVRASIRYTNRRLDRAERDVVQAQERLKVERHRKRRLGP